MRGQRWVLGVSGVLFATGFGSALASGCGSDESLPSSFRPDGSGGDDGGFGDGGGFLDGAGEAGDDVCASSSATATLTKKPVDILVVIDNSGSMGGEIAEVQNQINQNFANIIGASGIDYRVIMLTRHGALSAQSVCISSPLSDASCEAGVPPRPGENARFFQYNQEIASRDALCRILTAYHQADNTDGYTLHDAGIAPLFRPQAFKTLLVITDDRVTCSASVRTADGGTMSVTYDDTNTVDAGASVGVAFDRDLRLLDPGQFGSADAGRNYIFHSIVALAPFVDAGPYDAGDGGIVDPRVHSPSAPIVTAMCAPGAANPGTGYQGISMLTGGLRFPTCPLDYGAVFREMAKGVLQGAVVACDFPVPPAPAGQTLDLPSLAVQYTPGGGGAVQEFVQVPDVSQCAPGRVYVSGGASGTVHLCPAACSAVQADPAASLRVVSGCARITPR